MSSSDILSGESGPSGTNKQQSSEEHFDVLDAVELFNSKIDAALEKQRRAIVSEIELKSKPTDSTDLRGEGNKIQFTFNEERLMNLSVIEQKLQSSDVAGALEIIERERKAIKYRNKLLRIADKHGWGTVKEYVDSDIADNSEDASKLCSAISRASAKNRRFTPYDKNPKFGEMGAFDGLSARQLFRGVNAFQSDRQDYAPRGSYSKPFNTPPECFYCQLPGHVARFCPFSNQMQGTRPVNFAPSETVTSNSANISGKQ
jgi:hypothetical protein